jgi:Cu/Ag efflux pump CusA
MPKKKRLNQRRRLGRFARPMHNGKTLTGIRPPGVMHEKIYNRSELIAITTQTVLHNLIFGIALIFVIQWLFLV